MIDDRPRALLRNLIKRDGTTMKAVSAVADRNHAYIRKFLEVGSPRELPESVREALGEHFKVNPDDFRLTPKPTRQGGKSLSADPKLQKAAKDLGVDPKLLGAAVKMLKDMESQQSADPSADSKKPRPRPKGKGNATSAGG